MSKWSLQVAGVRKLSNGCVYGSNRGEARVVRVSSGSFSGWEVNVMYV